MRNVFILLLVLAVVVPAGAAATYTVTMVDGWSVRCDGIWKVHDMGPMSDLNAVGGTIVMDGSGGFVSAAIYTFDGSGVTNIVMEAHHYLTPDRPRAMTTVDLSGDRYVHIPGRLYLGAACGGTLSLYATMRWQSPRSEP